MSRSPNAIKRYIGWWLAVPRPLGKKQVGQIIETHEIYVRIREDNGKEDVIATSAVLDSRFGLQLFQSRNAAVEAAAAEARR